jgi:hypothetical protein
MADDKGQSTEIRELYHAMVLLTSLVLSVSRQLSDLKYVVFKKTHSDEEYENLRVRQEEIFQKFDQMVEKIAAIGKIIPHG